MRTRPRHRGFTLLELVLVLVIIGTTLAVAAPALRGWGRGAHLRNAADEFLALTRYARTQAVSTGNVHRLTVQDGVCQLMTQSGEEYVEVASRLGRLVLPPDYSIEIRLSSGDTTTAEGIEFFPTGRTQAARVRITSDLGESLDIECAAPAESFRIVNQGEVGR